MLDVVKVPIPKKGIVKEKRNNGVYIYYVLETYRNSKGQPTNKRVSI